MNLPDLLDRLIEGTDAYLKRLVGRLNKATKGSSKDRRKSRQSGAVAPGISITSIHFWNDYRGEYVGLL
jgi:hypothetical protein